VTSKPARQSSNSRKDRSQVGRIVLTLRKMLLSGEFHAGERLAEIALASQLGASRTPVRLALDQLAHEGLLEAFQTGGFKVREFAVADIWDAIEIRGVLEGAAARLAAERLSDPSELDKLRGCYHALEDFYPSEVQEFVSYFERNDAFHAELWRLAKSPMVEHALESAAKLPFAAPSALVIGFSSLTERKAILDMAIYQHQAIIEAIENREGARAESLAREHTRLSRNTLMKAFLHTEFIQRLPGASLIQLPHHSGNPSASINAKVSSKSS
jgi:GntR family transcriptional regulator, vanillate catabolism transcriptional regulator